MQKVYEVLKQIEETSSRNDKETILKENESNELLKTVLKFVYDPYIVTGLSDKKIKKKVKCSEGYDIYDVNELLEFLKQYNTGTDEIIYSVQCFIKFQPVELQKLYTNIATKSLTIGVTAKTLNKVYGDDFIPTFDVMLAHKYKDHAHKVKGDFIITQKLDGNRCVIIKENGSINIFSRQGQTIEGLVDIIAEAKQLPDNYVYDGELLLINDKNLDSKELFQDTQKIVRKKDVIKKNLQFHAFDMIKLEEFKKGKSKQNCINRKNILHDLFSNLQLKLIIEVPMLYVGSDKSKIDEFLKQALDNGQEGIMVNTCDGKYECKRSSEILKVKVMNSVDLKIVGFEEGTGKYVGNLGRINVEYKGNIVGCGSGFSDGDRQEIWNNQDKYLGKIVELQFFEETQNQNGGTSLRFPVFKGIRWDKTEPSYN